MPDEVPVNEVAVSALGLPSRAREAVAERLAEVGGLAPPTRPETVDFLIDVLLGALMEIPASGAPWSWGEFHNGGLQPLYDMTREADWPRVALCAVDLGLGDHAPTAATGETPTPRLALARNLTDATEQLLRTTRERLEAAGVSPYGPAATA